VGGVYAGRIVKDMQDVPYVYILSQRDDISQIEQVYSVYSVYSVHGKIRLRTVRLRTLDV